MTDILQLPGWQATSTGIADGELIIEAKYTVHADSCVKCGVMGSLYRHGTKTTKYRDSPIRGMPVVLDAAVQRYKCRECGETFLAELQGVDASRRMTERCLQYIKEQCTRDTFTRIAEHVGCTEGTVRNIAGDAIRELDGAFSPYLPEWLGIDETKLDRQMRCILTDVGNNRPVDILPDRDKPTLARWLHQFRDRSVVKGVAMDMWRPYRDTVKAVLGDVPVVIDKFHVVRMANQAVDKVRIRVQKDKDAKTRVSWKRSKVQLVKRPSNLSEQQRFNLEMWLANEPEVAVAYNLKEDFFSIYDMAKDDAIEAYDAFLVSVPDSMKADFKDLTTAMKNWRTEILAYFDYPITNGYTEALNGVAKVINRAGRGYSFDVMRARILYRNRPEAATAEPLPSFARMYDSRGSEEGHRLLVEALADGHCQSCFRQIDAALLQLHHVRSLVEGEPSKRLYICPDCHRRFHTEEAGDGNQVST